MATLDLNAARKARAAARETSGKKKDVISFTHGKTTFTCPPEMPIEFSILAGNNDLVAAFETLLDDQAPQLWLERPRLSVEDMAELSDWIADQYGFGPGESPPSDGS